MKISRKKITELIDEAINDDMSELRIAGDVDLDIEFGSEEDSSEECDVYDNEAEEFFVPQSNDGSYKLPMIDDSYSDEEESEYKFSFDEADDSEDDEVVNQEIIAEESLSRGALYRRRYYGRY